MKVFLTGGTGFLGGFTLKCLLEAGHQVRCLVRRGSLKKFRLPGTVELALGDVTAPLGKKLQGCDAVINLAGIIREFPANGITFERVHVAAVENLIQAAEKAAIKRFIHVSSVGVDLQAALAYHRTKYQGEKIVRESGVPYTIFRPTFIYGPGGRAIETFSHMIRYLPLYPIFGDGKGKQQPVWVKSVVDGMVKALSGTKHSNKTYEVGGPEILSFEEMIVAVGEVAGQRVRKIHIPLSLIRRIVYGMGKLSVFPLDTDSLEMMLQDDICDDKQYYIAFDIDPVCFKDGLKQMPQQEDSS